MKFHRSEIIFFVTLLLIIRKTAGAEDTLLLVQVFFRHGDRTPLHDFPKNPVNISDKFPEGEGQLTQIGKIQAYELGQFLRERYGNFLRDRYYPDEIVTFTSDFDRTKMTASEMLQGLYPSKEARNPVPYNTIPAKLDNIIGFGIPCPKYEQALNCYRYHGEGYCTDQNYSKFYDHIAEQTGVPRADMTFEKITHIFDTLYIQDKHGHGLPDWAKKPLKDHEDHLMLKISMNSFTALTYNKVAMRLRGSPILREILANIDCHISRESKWSLGIGCDQRLKKFRAYSGHDTTLSVILQVFGLYNNKIPPYASAIMIELYKRQIYTSCGPPSQDYYIKFFYKNCTDSPTVYDLEIPDCQFCQEDEASPSPPMCSVKVLKEIKRHIFLTTSDWYSDCKKYSQCGNCKRRQKEIEDENCTCQCDELGDHPPCRSNDWVFFW